MLLMAESAYEAETQQVTYRVYRVAAHNTLLQLHLMHQLT